jgi:adenosylhomocysteine nucleosidase
METASVAHVCHVNNIPFLAVRSITDTADHSGSEQFEANCAKTATVAKDITMALLAELKKEA